MGKSGGGKKVLSVKIKQPSKRPEDENTGCPAEFRKRTEDARQLILTLLAGVYFIAFLSIYLQIEGLYGTNGVTPIKSELKLGSRSSGKCLKDKYSLLCIVPGFFGLDSQHAMELTALVGILISSVAFMCKNCCTLPVYIILWALYFSIYQVGNVFMWFQWDILLLEAGILAILLAPWFPNQGSLVSKPKDLTTIWMVKWLLFRLMFQSGLVKLQSGCPTWWGLTALSHHFESQCIPTPLSYFAHHLPPWILQLMVVGTFYVEIIVPFAFFAPFKLLRRYAFWTQTLFQLSIILTGNYTFFNLLTIVLCVSLLDHEFFGHGENSGKFSAMKFINRSFSFVLIGLSLFYTGKYFGIKLNSDNTIASQTNFSRKELDWFVSLAVPYSIVLAFFTLCATILQSILISVMQMKGTYSKVTSFVSSVVYGGACVAIFALSLVPYTSLHKETNRALWPVLKDTYAETSRYHIANSYGLFRRMTGVEGRPEVILEYSNDANGPWKEYHFMYKPGNTSAAPVFVLPHQPRLDWQMWFAALSSYHDSPFMLSLTYRLLNGEKGVENLLDTSKMPLTTPKYIRASAYTYHFTNPKSKEASQGQWWSRKREKEFMPIFAKDHKPLVDFVKNLGHLEPDIKTANPNSFLTLMLDRIRQMMVASRPEYVMWGSIFALFIVMFSSKMVSGR